jgi:hypothetical protein
MLALGALAALLALVAAAAVLLGPGPGTTVVATDPSTPTTVSPTTVPPATSTSLEPAPTTTTTADPSPSTTSTSSTSTPPTTVAPPPQCSASQLSSRAGDQAGLPAPVAERRQEIVAAALACDYDALAELAGAPTAPSPTATATAGTPPATGERRRHGGNDPCGTWPGSSTSPTASRRRPAPRRPLRRTCGRRRPPATRRTGRRSPRPGSTAKRSSRPCNGPAVATSATGWASPPRATGSSWSPATDSEAGTASRRQRPAPRSGPWVVDRRAPTAWPAPGARRW